MYISKLHFVMDNKATLENNFLKRGMVFQSNNLSFILSFLRNGRQKEYPTTYLLWDLWAQFNLINKQVTYMHRSMHLIWCRDNYSHQIFIYLFMYIKKNCLIKNYILFLLNFLIQSLNKHKTFNIKITCLNLNH